MAIWFQGMSFIKCLRSLIRCNNSIRTAFWRIFQWANHHTLQTITRIPIEFNERSGVAPSVRQVNALRLFDGIRSIYGGSWKGDLLVANVGELQEDDVSDVYLRRIETTVLVSGDIFICPFFERFCKVDRKKVLKSDHPTEFGKTSKKEKKEHRSDLQGETDKPDSAEQQREQDELEAKYDFWSISGSFISRTHVLERQKMHVSQDISLPMLPK